jgi:hypothetical protein
MRGFIKFTFNLLSQLVVLPLVILCWLEKTLIPKQPELVFNICTNIVALLPGVPGAFLRRAFYTLSLEKCSPHCHIGFGTIISHRCAIIDKHAYIGSYAYWKSAPW